MCGRNLEREVEKENLINNWPTNHTFIIPTNCYKHVLIWCEANIRHMRAVSAINTSWRILYNARIVQKIYLSWIISSCHLFNAMRSYLCLIGDRCLTNRLFIETSKALISVPSAYCGHIPMTWQPTTFNKRRRRVRRRVIRNKKRYNWESKNASVRSPFHIRRIPSRHWSELSSSFNIPIPLKSSLEHHTTTDNTQQQKDRDLQ